MRRRRSMLLSAGAVVLALVLVGASSAEIKAYLDGRPKPVALLVAGPTPAPAPTALPEPTALPQPTALPEPAATLGPRAQKAIADAERNGADISFTLLDRATGKVVSEEIRRHSPSPRWPSFSSPTTCFWNPRGSGHS